ncbi:hypothetical protein KZ829_29130 [Actinoplanes hulinensis]|uniref:Uncharacterized protein n=1 Tax=Actinoplanes hulinensis TaxID=1144547 RepID=A0ABS7B9R4_9ACTN|nr:hypothetical protein [Actinoplanes hulinensis]MBW6437807.1 hypothetical protein [Actinoplanes hulinensis]
MTVCAPLIWFAARAGDPLPVGSVLPPVAAALVSAVVATFVGVLLGLHLTREAHLFTYFKNR